MRVYLSGGAGYVDLPESVGGGASSTFVYRPGALDPQPPLYNDWPTMMAAVGLVPGPKIIQIDDSIQSPAPIPAGAWSMLDVTLVGSLSVPSSVKVRLEDGATLPDFTHAAYQLVLTSVSSAPITTFPDNGVLLLERGAGIDSAPGAAPFLDAPGPYISTPTIVLDLGASFGTTPGNRVLQVGSGVVVTFLIENVVTLPDDVLEGLGGAVFVYLSSSQFQTDGQAPPPHQPGLTVFAAVSTNTPTFATYYCDDGLGDPTLQTFLTPGYGLTSSLNAGVSVEPLRSGILTTMVVRANGGGVANAGKSVTYQLNIDGTDVPGAKVVIDAEFGGGGFASFLTGYQSAGIVKIRATPSATLLAPINSIIASIA